MLLREFNLQDRHNGEPRSSREREGACVPVCVCVFTLACVPMRWQRGLGGNQPGG